MIQTKSKYLQKLKDLHRKDFFKRKPNFPERAYPHPKFSQKDANELTKCICKYITFRGGVADRIGNNPIKDPKTGKWRKGTRPKGFPDITGVFQGRSIQIEVKFGKDRMSEAQKLKKVRMERAGALYYIARDFDGFYKWFTGIFGEE